MGNTSPRRVNDIYENVKLLEEIGRQIDDVRLNKDIKKEIIHLYQLFYYPRDSLTKLEEIYTNHYQLRRILRKNIKLYNEYNTTNIDVENYVETSVKNLQPTLRVIGVF